MASLNFFNSSVITGFPKSGKDRPEPPNLEYRARVDVWLLGTGPFSGPFEDFKVGLGLVQEDGKLAYRDCRNEIVFHQQDVPRTPVLVLWTERFVHSNYIGTFLPVLRARIEITPQPTGLFAVKTRIRKKYAPTFPVINDMLVSKAALPTVVLAQVLFASRVLGLRREARKRGSFSQPVIDAGEALHALEDRFFAHPSSLLGVQCIYEAIDP
jgi:hypothetical protein